jgi:uncharacterized protein (DUF362 family)/NAD-dependent dihydropyrimidine dehydrogenase PreA subunit
MKSKVVIVRCESYDENKVYGAMKRGLNLLGGIEKFVKKGEKILLKPNSLAGVNPEKAVTTHPSVFNAIIKILLEKKVKVTYGDSPGIGVPSAVLEKSGFTKIAKKYGIKLGDFENGKDIELPQGKICKKFHIANACLESDGIISLPKMKTHGLTRITGAIKNQFGCVAGLKKAYFHAKIPNPVQFSRMLLDLQRLLKPRLFIMDGIVAMEGNGPSGGDPIKMNCLILSSDPIAMDATFCKIINLNPKFVPTIKYGKTESIGTYLPEEIDYLGDSIESFVNKKFNVQKIPVSNYSLKFYLPEFVIHWISPKPVIEPKKCIKCGICIEACPVKGKAIHFKDKNKKEPPVYDYKKCIRCFCCQEMCPQKAISIRSSTIRKLFPSKHS